MNLKDKRQIARQATRSYLRSMGFTVEEMTASVALKAIDDITRSDPDLIASIWWTNASDTQISLFYQEWHRWYKKQVIGF